MDNSCEIVAMRLSSFDTFNARNGFKGKQHRTTTADISRYRDVC